MFNNIFIFIEVFILIFCILNVIKNTYNIAKVFYQQEGKADFDTITTILFGMSLSYIITTMIVGF